jgi:hypothetical protein
MRVNGKHPPPTLKNGGVMQEKGAYRILHVGLSSGSPKNEAAPGPAGGRPRVHSLTSRNRRIIITDGC